MANKPERGVIFLCKIRVTRCAAGETEINLPALRNSNKKLLVNKHNTSPFAVITDAMQVKSRISGGGDADEAENECKKGKKVCRCG